VQTLALNVLGRGVRVRCADPLSASLLTAAYGSMRGGAGSRALDYTVRRAGRANGAFRLERAGRAPLVAADDGALLALFDADIAIEIQRLRHDLYVVHAAVLELRDAAVMLVAKSGVGKSTLSWALLHHGLGFLSDELGPVDLATLEILPYPRALMVKRAPPPPYPIAAGAVRTSRGFHVPADALPAPVRARPAALAAIFFLQRFPEPRSPALRRLTPAEGAARLYANALNPLAHGGDGLDGAIRIAAACPCFELVTAELAPTCALVTGALARLP
jgi:hypothetical protein